MTRRSINPWTWQEAIGFSHGVVTPASAQVVYLSGQVSCAADGTPLHRGDLAAQVATALDHIEAVLTQGGFALAHVVRLNIYTTDVDGYHRLGSALVQQRLQAAGAQYTSTLLGVQRLALPEFLVELEATASA